MIGDENEGAFVRDGCWVDATVTSLNAGGIKGLVKEAGHIKGAFFQILVNSFDLLAAESVLNRRDDVAG